LSLNACIQGLPEAPEARQHFLYFFPLPQGQGSFRPIFGPLEGVGAGVSIDFEGACFAEGSFHRPQYEMLFAVSLIGRNLSALSRRDVAGFRLASCSNSSRVVANGSTIPFL